MAFPLLIDTNILLKLISTVDISPTLLQLDWMVNKHYVTLLVPEVLKEEWNKHRQGGIKKINAAVTEFKMNARRSRTVDDPLTGLREEQAEEFEEELLKQMDIIDTLVKTAGVFLPRTIDLTLLVREWKAKDKAPFKSSSHKDNWNDAELILSAAAYCTVSSQISLCFVSENKKEFADPVLNDLRLHPHISEHYPSLAFEYHLDIRDAFRSLQEQGIPHYKPEERENYNKIYNFIPVDRSLPILNQVYQYLTARFVDWRNIPKHLFTEHYPFILAEQFPSYHQPFTLITDNPEVFALLTEIKVDRDQVIQGKEKFITNEVDEEQLLYILQCLTRNLITEVAMGNNGPVHIQYTPVTVTCDCALCKFNRFQFTDLFQPMMEGGKPALAFDERWRNAYVQYKLCNYTRAAKEMQQLLQEIEGQRSVARYLLSFNLILLGKMIRNMIWNDEEAVRWGEELTRMDLDKILKACR
ncbi:MAG TPA: PIN domain-containing protein, partial [Flavitalea sp.]|nr:PIN domain-containing protein [Flavitalea sp.]